MQGSEINGVAHNSTLWSFKTEIILKKHKYALETKWQPQRDNQAIIFASRNKAILSCEWFLLSILCWEGTCLRGNQFPGACHPLPTLESNRESRWDPRKKLERLVLPLGCILKNHSCLVTQLCSTFCDPHGLQPTWLLCQWNFPGKNTGESCHFLLQRIFPIQRLKPCLLCLLHWQAGSLPLSQLESPNKH